MASPKQPLPTRSEADRDRQRVERSDVEPPGQRPPVQDPLAEWRESGDLEAPAGWLERTWNENFGRIQLAALAVSLIGILLTAVAAIRAANPQVPIGVTLIAATLLILTVVKPARSQS